MRMEFQFRFKHSVQVGANDLTSIVKLSSASVSGIVPDMLVILA